MSDSEKSDNESRDSTSDESKNDLCATDITSYSMLTHVSKKEINKFNKSDYIILPPRYENYILTNNKFIMKISHNDKFVYGKAFGYTSPITNIVMPRHLINRLGLSHRDNLSISFSEPNKVHHLKIKTSVRDPLSILEFELRNRTFLYKDEIIQAKIFTTTYDFHIVQLLDHEDKEIDVGIIHDGFSNDLRISFE